MSTTHITIGQHSPPTRLQTNIDLVGPLEACEMLLTDETALVDLVNSGRLPAFRLGSCIRFRTGDVTELARSCP